MGVRRKKIIINKKSKTKTVSLMEMEIAISNLFGYTKSIIVPNISWGFDIHECDLFIIKSSGYVNEIEIKRSVADTKNDANKKHDHSDNRIREFYFAFPIELYDKCKDLVPKHAGIITVGKTQYGKIYRASIVRDATINKNSRKLTIEEQLKVARLGTLRIWSLKKKLVTILSKK
jgi:hypothetical protein